MSAVADHASMAVVKKEFFTFLHCAFNVEVPGPGDLQATGDFSDHEYRFLRRHRHGLPRRSEAPLTDIVGG